MAPGSCVHASSWAIDSSVDSENFLVQQQVCRYTVPWALFEESMPPVILKIPAVFKNGSYAIKIIMTFDAKSHRIA